MVKATRIAAGLVLAFLLAVNVYRAVTQSMTHDEALTYKLYISAPVSQIFTFNNPNNHFLATVLMRFSTAVLGVSDLSMRLPSLAAGALYFYTVYRLSVLLFGGGFFLLLSVLLMAANPLLLDFLVAARGYGPAVAFLTYGFYCLLVYRTASRYRWSLLYRGAVAISLGVMSNLAVLVPAGVVTALFLATLAPPAPPAKAGKRSRAPVVTPPGRVTEAIHFLAPAAALAAIFLLLMPVDANPPGGFYRIGGSIADSFESVVAAAFAHAEGLGGGRSEGDLRYWWVKLLTMGAFPAVVFAGLVVSARSRERDLLTLALLWSSGAVAGSIFLHIAGFLLAGVPVPADRTGVYFFPLLGLTLVLLACVLRRRAGSSGPAVWTLGALGAVLAVQYAAQFNWTNFYVWRYDADNKEIVRELERISAAAESPPGIGVSWQLEPSLNYYRETWGLNRLNPFYRERRMAGHEYLVLIPKDRHLIAERKLEILYQGPKSGTVLARRP